jgi:Intermembrane lipid transfer protein VPS13, C-terminal
VNRGSRLRLEWDVSFNQLQGVTIEDTGIRFSDKAGREYDRFVPVPKKSKMWFYKEIEKWVTPRIIYSDAKLKLDVGW